MEKEDFISVLENYSIGTYKRHRYLDKVLASDIYILFTTKGKFVLKFLEKTDLEDFKDQLKLIDFLYSRNIPVVKNIKDKKGRELIKYKRKNLIIQDFIEGVHPQKFSNALVEDIARNLGKMHKVLLNSKFIRKKKHEYKKRDLGESINPEKVRAIQNDLLESIREIDFKKLRVARIHGDISEINMLVRKDRLKSFIDFDDSDYDYLVYEIAIFIAHSFVRSDTIHWEKIKLFLMNYQKYIKLNDEEKKVVYYLIKYRLIGILFWHFRYMRKYPKKKAMLKRGIRRSADRLINFDKNNLEKFMEVFK